MKTKDITTIAFMTALLVVSSQLAIPIGPIPLTLQTLAIFLIGFLLTPKNAFLSTFLFLVLGLIGLPVFSGFTGGLQSLLLPSFGFVLSFMPASYFQAYYLENNPHPRLKDFVVAGLINLIITYTIGLLYMVIILSLQINDFQLWEVVTIALTFLPGDLLKLSFAILLTRRVRPVLLQKI